MTLKGVMFTYHLSLLESVYFVDGVTLWCFSLWYTQCKPYWLDPVRLSRLSLVISFTNEGVVTLHETTLGCGLAV